MNNQTKKSNKPTKAPKRTVQKGGSGQTLKQLEAKKKKIFKPILSNPYTKTTSWPLIKPEILRDILQLLTTKVFAQVQNYHAFIASKRQQQQQLEEQSSEKIELPQPTEYKYFKTGFNSVMQLLENQVNQVRNGTFNAENDDTIRYLFVCKNDMTSPLLYSHFPLLTQLSKVKLIQLPRNSNSKLKEAIYGGSDSEIGKGKGGSIEILCLSNGFLKEHSVLKHVIEENVDLVEIDFLENKLGMDVKFLLTDQPIGKRNNKGSK